MIQCWEYRAEDRPTFKKVLGKISNYVEGIAGYLEVNFNPFKERGSTSAVQVEEEREEDMSDSDVEIHVYPSSSLTI